MRVDTRTDRRFRRSRQPAQLRAVARRRRRLGAAVALGGVLIAGAYQAATRLLAAPFLAVDAVVVEGNHRLSDGEVLALLRGLVGTNILMVDLEAQRRRLLASDWLRDGTLRRVLPSTIEVLVSERRPVALARFEGRLFLVDGGGAVIDRHGPRFADLDLPIIDGLDAGSATPTVDGVRMALAARVLDRLAARPDVLAAVSQIDVSDPYDAVVLLDGDPALLHLGADRFLERLRSYAELAPTLRERVDAIDYVDLRFEPRVYVGPVGGAAPAPRGGRRVAAGPATP